MNKEEGKNARKQAAKAVIAAKSQEQATAQVSAIVQEQRFQGPLPPPEILARYNAVVPNGAERIMAMAEREQRHSHQMDLLSICSVNVGQFLGFLIVAGAIVSGAFLVFHDKPISGFGIFFSGLGVLLGGGYVGRVKLLGKRKENQAEPSPH